MASGSAGPWARASSGRVWWREWIEHGHGQGRDDEDLVVFVSCESAKVHGIYGSGVDLRGNNAVDQRRESAVWRVCTCNTCTYNTCTCNTCNTLRNRTVLHAVWYPGVSLREVPNHIHHPHPSRPGIRTPNLTHHPTVPCRSQSHDPMARPARGEAQGRETARGGWKRGIQ